MVFEGEIESLEVVIEMCIAMVGRNGCNTGDISNMLVVIWLLVIMVILEEILERIVATRKKIKIF